MGLHYCQALIRLDPDSTTATPPYQKNIIQEIPASKTVPNPPFFPQIRISFTDPLMDSLNVGSTNNKPEELITPFLQYVSRN